MKSNVSVAQTVQTEKSEFLEVRKVLGREFRDELLSFKNWAALILDKKGDERLQSVLRREGLDCNKLTINWLMYVYKDKSDDLTPFDGKVLCKFRKYDAEKHGDREQYTLYMKGKTEYFKERVTRLTFIQFLNIFKSATKVHLKDIAAKQKAEEQTAETVAAPEVEAETK